MYVNLVLTNYNYEKLMEKVEYLKHNMTLNFLIIKCYPFCFIIHYFRMIACWINLKYYTYVGLK